MNWTKSSLPHSNSRNAYSEIHKPWSVNARLQQCPGHFCSAAASAERGCASSVSKPWLLSGNPLTPKQSVKCIQLIAAEKSIGIKGGTHKNTKVICFALPSTGQAMRSIFGWGSFKTSLGIMLWIWRQAVSMELAARCSRPQSWSWPNTISFKGTSQSVLLNFNSNSAVSRVTLFQSNTYSPH